MPSYQVYCSDCDVECSIMTFERTESVPSVCAFCGVELDDTNVREESGDEDDWDRLSAESLGELDDWKE